MELAKKQPDIGNAAYKQTELGLIPSDWELKRLGDVGEIKMCRRVFNHETSSSGEIPYFVMWSVVRIRNWNSN